MGAATRNEAIDNRMIVVSITVPINPVTLMLYKKLSVCPAYVETKAMLMARRGTKT